MGGSAFLGGAIRGALGSAITQGIGVATGLQKKFDWAGVAAAGVGGGLLSAMGVEPISKTNKSLGAYASNVGALTATAIANAATRTALGGGNFGDNLLAALPDVIGSTIGNMLANGVAGLDNPRETSMARLRREGGIEVAQNADPNVRSDAPTLEEEIVVTGKRMTEQQKREYDAKHGFFWHLGNILSGRNWDGTENENYKARAQAERATSDSVIRALRRLDKAATDTKLSPRFYYLQNPPMSVFDYQLEKPRYGVAQVNAKGAALGVLEVAALLPALRAGKYVEGMFELTEGIAINGRRAIDLAGSYEKGIRGLYGEASLGTREFDVVVNGQRLSGIADDVARINGRPTAIEAKYVDDWATSPRNPTSPIGKIPWAVDEQKEMISQAQKYSAAFKGGAIYHTNSAELAAHYAAAFKSAGIRNVRFIITPAIR